MSRLDDKDTGLYFPGAHETARTGDGGGGRNGWKGICLGRQRIRRRDVAF